MSSEAQIQEPTPEAITQDEAASLPIAETTAPTRRRKPTEERLKLALAKQEALQTKINLLQAELDEKKSKSRKRGLVLVGVVVEQCLKGGFFDSPQEIHRDWWAEQVTLLSKKDHSAYLEFLQSLREGQVEKLRCEQLFLEWA